MNGGEKRLGVAKTCALTMVRTALFIWVCLPLIADSRVATDATEEAYYDNRSQLLPSAVTSMAELRQFAAFKADVAALTPGARPLQVPSSLTADNGRKLITAGMATFALHTESRIAAAMGEGFYTIGPCGEELLGAIGLLLRTEDALALHYRHLAAQVARHLRSKSLDDIILDRARSHVVSVNDPVTHGAHCALGGDDYSFVVTSTLASQAPPAVGRALGSSLAHQLGLPSKFQPDFVSFVSLGDGSMHNAHALSALNLAEYALHRGFKCPTVFAISNNGLSISFPDHGWMSTLEKRTSLPVLRCDGSDALDVWATTEAAIAQARSTSQPRVLVYDNLPRRFGHAATDRQSAYLSAEKIAQLEASNPLLGKEAVWYLHVSCGLHVSSDEPALIVTVALLLGACQTALDLGWFTTSELSGLVEGIEQTTTAAFAKATCEDKPKLDDVMRVQRKAADPQGLAFVKTPAVADRSQQETEGPSVVMRKAMTRALDEVMTAYPDVSMHVFAHGFWT
jgi:2-oxoisovalerate dehydrogenase E1 component